MTRFRALTSDDLRHCRNRITATASTAPVTRQTAATTPMSLTPLRHKEFKIKRLLA